MIPQFEFTFTFITVISDIMDHTRRLFPTESSVRCLRRPISGGSTVSLLFPMKRPSVVSFYFATRRVFYLLTKTENSQVLELKEAGT